MTVRVWVRKQIWRLRTRWIYLTWKPLADPEVSGLHCEGGSQGAGKTQEQSKAIMIRDPLALAMFAAWCNLPVDKLPEAMRAHTCAATAEAWGRVADAARSILSRAQQGGGDGRG